MDLEPLLSQTSPVIVIGMHRSGTTLTARLLMNVGVHMGINLSTNCEPPYFQRLNRRIFAAAGARWSNVEPILQTMRSDVFVEGQVNAIREALFRQRGLKGFFGPNAWNAICQREPLVWGWKEPLTTITFPIWVRIFPCARVIHIIRNGIDVAISMHRRTHRVKKQWWKWGWYLLAGYGSETLDFRHCFRVWEQYVSFALERKHLIPPGQYFEMRYEDLLAEPHGQMRCLLSFLAYPIEEKRLQAACEQINRDRLNSLRNARNYQNDVLEFASSPLMQQLGYSPIFRTLKTE